MPVTCRSEVKGDYLHVVAEGSLSSVDEMVDYVDRMHARLLRVGLSKVLVDETKCLMHLTLENLMEIAGKVPEPVGFEPDLPKAAIICSTINHPLSKHVFEPLPRIRVFVDEEKAKTWLTAED